MYILLYQKEDGILLYRKVKLGEMKNMAANFVGNLCEIHHKTVFLQAVFPLKPQK